MCIHGGDAPACVDRAQSESGDSRACSGELGLVCLVCNTPVASFLLLKACKSSLDKPGFSGPVQCLFQNLEGI